MKICTYLHIKKVKLYPLFILNKILIIIIIFKLYSYEDDNNPYCFNIY